MAGVQIPRPMLMGMAQAKVAQRTMRQQVEDYLLRIRHTLPFPCSFEDAYFGCVPPAIKELMESDARKPGRATNLMSTMFATLDKTAKPNILHVSAEDEREFLEAQQGRRGNETVFWFEAPPYVPVPRNSVQHPFYLPEDHPFHDEIMNWVRQALLIEDELQVSLDLIDRYSAIVKTATQVKNTWPELLNFIHVGRHEGLSNQVAKELRDRAAKVMRPTDKEALTFQLARAVMLPENPPPMQAWVKFYTGDNK